MTNCDDESAIPKKKKIIILFMKNGLTFTK